MLRKLSISALSLALFAAGLAFTPAAQAAKGSCASITKALVVGCVSPADIAKYSGGRKMTATQYLASVVKDSAGAMKKTPVAGINDYLDFGNGKEDGIGSTAKAGSLRLDA